MSVQTIGELVSLGWAVGQVDIQIVEGEVLIFIPWLAVITFALDILELAGIIPNPISLLLQMFAGRPKEEATIQCAQRLLNARNPAARLFGMALERLVAEYDIVLSTDGSGRAILDLFTQQFVNNLVAQGVSKTRAFDILVASVSEEAQHGLPLEPELQQPLSDQLNFNADPNVLRVLQNQYEIHISAGKTIKQALQLAERYVYKHVALEYLKSLSIGQLIVPNPPPPLLLPNQDGQCPNGYTLQDGTELCALDTNQTTPPPPPPIPPPPPGPQPGGQPEPDGDEITQTLCSQMAANTTALISAIQGMSGAPAPLPNENCCAEIVTSIGNVIVTLASIAKAIAAATPTQSSGAGPDYTAVLTRIAAALDTAPGEIPALPDLAPPPYARPGPYTPETALADVLDLATKMPNVDSQ